MESGRCSTRRIVLSVTLSAEHTLKHHYEATKGFLVTNPSMLLDKSTKMVAFTLKLKIYLRPPEKLLYVCIDHVIHEEPMYNVNSCHAVASYYSSVTLLSTQTVTATATFPHCMVERTPRKLETTAHTLHTRKFALTVLNAWNCRETLELRKM